MDVKTQQVMSGKFNVGLVAGIIVIGAVLLFVGARFVLMPAAGAGHVVTALPRSETSEPATPASAAPAAPATPGTVATAGAAGTPGAPVTPGALGTPGAPTQAPATAPPGAAAASTPGTPATASPAVAMAATPATPPAAVPPGAAVTATPAGPRHGPFAHGGAGFMHRQRGNQVADLLDPDADESGLGGGLPPQRPHARKHRRGGGKHRFGAADPTAAKAEAPPPGPDPSTTLSLVGTVVSPGMSLAYVQEAGAQRVLQVGDTVNGYRVASITDYAVTFRSGDTTRLLYPDANMSSAPAGAAAAPVPAQPAQQAPPPERNNPNRENRHHRMRDMQREGGWQPGAPLGGDRQNGAGHRFRNGR